MSLSRRSFLKHAVNVFAMTLGVTQLAGCLGGGGSGSDSASSSPAAAAASSPVQSDLGTAPATNVAAGPTQTPMNSAPVWNPSPTIEFVEGVPAVVSIAQFVQDPDSDAFAIQLRSGAMPPGIMWNPSTASVEYDGRPLGAKPDAPVVLTGVTFSADDLKP
jgi:hypothetical protein